MCRGAGTRALSSHKTPASSRSMFRPLGSLMQNRSEEGDSAIGTFASLFRHQWPRQPGDQLVTSPPSSVRVTKTRYRRSRRGVRGMDLRIEKTGVLVQRGRKHKRPEKIAGRLPRHEDPKPLPYASHPCPKPVGESSAWPTDEPRAPAHVIVCTDTPSSTNS